MQILIDRTDGRIQGPDLSIERWYREAHIMRMDAASVNDGRGGSDLRIRISKRQADGYEIYFRYHLRSDVLSCVEIGLSRKDQLSWSDWSAEAEREKLRLLLEMLDRSGIENGKHLSWGMANAYYDGREGCSVLRVHYRSRWLSRLPDPMPSAPILP